jgi:hypothetical protein
MSDADAVDPGAVVGAADEANASVLQSCVIEGVDDLIL